MHTSRFVQTLRFSSIVLSFAVLTACGGGGGGKTTASSSSSTSSSSNTYILGGTVTGLSASGLVLQNNNSDDLVISGGGNFKFPTPFAKGIAYKVGIAIQPAGQLCTVANGVGMGSSDVTSVSINCITPALAGFVGKLGGAGFLDGTGTVYFSQPYAITQDANGTFYIADSDNCAIRKMTTDGVVTTLAGGTYGFEDGAGKEAKFYDPRGIAIDNSGNLYVTDSGNHAIRKITPTGVVTTFAGSTEGFTDGLGAAARFHSPQQITIDHNGMLYVADMINNAIRKITPEGIVTTVAGGTQGSSDGTGSAAQFTFPWGVTVDNVGNLYVADTGNYAIRKITPDGVVTTLAGGTRGFTDGRGTEAKFDAPISITIDNSGNIYVADNGGNPADGGASGNSAIRKITPEGMVSTVAGGTKGFAEGTGVAAKFDSPFGIYSDTSNNLYIADTFNHAIRKITPLGVTTTLAGGDIKSYGSNTTLNYPEGIAVDATGNLYVADHSNHSIRKITPAGVVTTFASGADFDPRGVAIDSNGNVYVTSHDAIYKAPPVGEMTIFAGGTSGFADGIGTAAKLRFPRSITIDTTGNLYVADTNNHAIRKITPTGVVTTVAGDTIGFSDGIGAAAKFSYPSGITIDAGGNLYVSDSNQTIRKIAQTGVVTTIAGGIEGFADGTGAAAHFRYPGSITIDSGGNLYVADMDNYAVRKITPAGVVTTLVGQAGKIGFLAGNLPGVIEYPRGVLVVGNSLYISQSKGIAKVTLF